MNIEERVTKTEKRIDRGENRTKMIEQAILQMKDLVIRHEERLDDFSQTIRESREDFNFKLNAAIDLQMENEVGLRETRKELKESINELRESIGELKESTTELRRASESQLTRIEKLESK